MNKEELLYKLNIIIEYLKNKNDYEYKLYNHLCPDNDTEPDSNIVEYAQDIENIIQELLKKLES